MIYIKIFNIKHYYIFFGKLQNCNKIKFDIVSALHNNLCDSIFVLKINKVINRLARKLYAIFNAKSIFGVYILYTHGTYLWLKGDTHKNKNIPN